MGCSKKEVGSYPSSMSFVRASAIASAAGDSGSEAEVNSRGRCSCGVGSSGEAGPCVPGFMWYGDAGSLNAARRAAIVDLLDFCRRAREREAGIPIDRRLENMT